MELQRKGGVRGWEVAKVREAIADILFPKETDTSLLGVMRVFANTKEKPNTKQKYEQTIKRIEQWKGAAAKRIEFGDVNVDFLKKFEKHMTDAGLNPSSRSIHMRNLRTVFNYAIENDLTSAPYPFRKFKIKAVQTQPSALTLEQLRKLWNCEPAFKAQRYCLDIWKLIFCLIGINMADLYDLEKIKQGRIEYTRKKTGRLYSVKVEPEAMGLIEAHKGRKALLDIGQRYKHVHMATAQVNKKIKEVAKQIGLPPITVYTARYTWATLAAGIDIPIEVISQALGHSYGLAVTLGYIMPDRRKVDEANRKVLDLLK